MNCLCGAPIVENANNGNCATCQRQNIACPSCGGGISAAPEAVIIACPYCDSSLRHKEISAQPPYFPVNLNADEAQQRLLDFLLNRFGIPVDFQNKFQVNSCKQIFIPIHLFTLTARLNESISETDTITIPGNRSVWYANEIANYRFAARVKQLMDPDKVKARVYSLEVDEEQAVDEARAFGRELIQRDRERFSEVERQDHIEHQAGGQVFYPLYEFEYKYGTNTFKAVMDAANGVVCVSEHPMSKQSRSMVMATGTGLLGFTGLVTAGFLALGITDPIFFSAAGVAFLTGLAASGRLIWTSIQSHSSGEEIAAVHQALDVDNLIATLPFSDRKTLE